MPVQSRPSVAAEERADQPAGTACWIVSGETFHIAVTPMMIDVSVRMKNCMTSVMTTLIMPPLIA